MNGRPSFTSGIHTKQDAEEALRNVRKVFYAVGLISGTLACILFLDGLDLALEGLGNSLSLLLFGYFLPKTKSRTLAIVVFLIALYSIAVTFTHIFRLFGHPDVFRGGSNIVLAGLVFWMAIRGTWATFIYHSRLKTKTIWRHVTIVWSIAILVVAVVFAIEVAGLAWLRSLNLSEEVVGLFLIGPIAATFILCLLKLSKHFPLIRLSEPT